MRLSLTAPVAMQVAGALLWLTSLWLSHQLWRRSNRSRAARRLEIFRSFLVTLIVASLLKPEIQWRTERNEKPVVAVLCDASGSMATRDVVGSNRVASRAETISNLLQMRFWAPLEAGSRVVVEEFSPVPTNATALPGTDLSSPLNQLLQREPNLKAVVLLTDGDWNLGEPPVGVATRYRERGIPIFSAAVGSGTHIADLSLESVSVPSYGILGEQISLPFRIQNHLGRALKTEVVLLEGDREMGRRSIDLPARGDLQEAIVWSPRSPGEKNLTLRLAHEADDLLPENDQRSFAMNVRVETLKVLVVDSLPRWEYRYLRNALARDPGISVNCVLFHPEIGMGGGRDYLKAFPESKEELSRYDVVFLGDVGIGRGELATTNAFLLRGLVEQQGSGLVFIPGRRGRTASFADSPLSELIPVALNADQPAGTYLKNESTLNLTTMGREHWLTKLDADETRNEEIWKQLPGFYWSAAVEKSRPGSDVLAVHSSQRNSWGRLPLLATRQAGLGKVLFLGTDSAWRWRRGVEDLYHYRFWSQVVRWMAHQRHLSEKPGLRVAFSPETPSPGDTVYLQATLLDASGFPAQEGPLNGRLTSPSGRVERLALNLAEGGWGLFQSSFVTREPGVHRLVLESERHGRKLETELTVTRPDREKIGEPIKTATLEELAAMTQGRVGSHGSLPELVKAISLIPDANLTEHRVRLWCSPAWGGFLLALWGIYWTGRKLAGMI